MYVLGLWSWSLLVYLVCGRTDVRDIISISSPVHMLLLRVEKASSTLGDTMETVCR